MSILTEESPEQALDWLENRIKRRHIPAKVHRRLVKQEDRYLHVPVAVRGKMDVYDKVVILQRLEDAWNNQAKRPYWHLFLVPAAK